ncbi:MAG: RluA family pseudouridine synthase, partial [Alphaproteobacteria bacterium]|nr:RluA family pseudouridine synthase [Alphaproteobacteria bacterium]
GGVKRPGIVHRLDKDTSGIMVVAKSDIVHKGLSAQFAEHSLERKYKAIVWGIPKPIKGTIERRIGRSPFDRKKMAVLKKGGRDAITHYKLIKTLGTYASLIECKLETGRTHQIRVHMTSKGYSLVNDPVYGGDRKAFTAKLSKEERQLIEDCVGQALHAYLLGFTHPVTNEYLRFENKMPDAMKDLVKILEKY